jgi:hypothetical protein
MTSFGKIFLFTALLGLSLMVVSIGYTMSADKSIDFSVKEATKQAMYTGIKKGCVRVTENVVLDEKVTKEALVRSVAELSTYENGTVYLDIHKLSTNPAMLSVEAYHVIDTPFQSYLNIMEHTNKSSKTTTREFAAAIFEAKQTQKPTTATQINGACN